MLDIRIIARAAEDFYVYVLIDALDTGKNINVYYYILDYMSAHKHVPITGIR